MRQADGETVAAVVVTYNRKNLLDECLQALLRQTRPLDGIIIIDNASTDGTPDFLAQKGYLSNPIIDYVRLPENTGGAGGFHEGVKRGYEKGFYWLWLMDDDTIPQPAALEKLFWAVAESVLRGIRLPAILASKVIWVDGTVHPMNFPAIRTSNPDSFIEAIEMGLASIRGASFVSLLISRATVSVYGLPCKDFFIWNDDVEYTHRVLRDNIGFLVPQSIVLHKSSARYLPFQLKGKSAERYFFEVRNKIWCLKLSSFTRKEKLRILGRLLWQTFVFLRNNRNLIGIKTVMKGVIHGLLYKPKL